jgi:hypothetical protein
MTFPDMINSTASAVSGYIALAAGIVLAWKGKSLPFVAAVCCIAVLITELIMKL